ncbi:MAG: XrtB/PEP-CTERM-associated polysaccharide biosynthesis outer membrane protein EpsL [Acidobacteriaceae bacterium]
MLLGALAVLISPPAYSWKGDVFQPFVSYGDTYSDNILYLPKHTAIVLVQNGVPELITGPLSDTFRTLRFGADIDWRVSRQQILLKASENVVRYSRYTLLNYNGSNLRSRWNWRLGSRWDGSIGASRHTTQSNFSNLLTFAAINNIYTERRAFANGGLWLDPHWKIGIDSAESRLTNSSPYETYTNYDQNSVGPFIEYHTRKGSSLTTQFLAVNSRYPNLQLINGSAVDNSYRENQLNFTGSWVVTGKTQIQGEFGFIDRRNKNLPQRNFSGITSSLGVSYTPTGSTSLGVSVYRRSAGADIGYASFVLDTGQSLSAAWQMTGTLTLEGGLAHDRFNYEGDPGILLGFPHRIDNVENASLVLKYKPEAAITVDLGAVTGYRNSTYSFYDYHFNSVFADLQFKP